MNPDSFHYNYTPAATIEGLPEIMSNPLATTMKISTNDREELSATTEEEQQRLSSLHQDETLVNSIHDNTSIPAKKHKSLVSVYDNSNDGEHQQIIGSATIGIFGRNKRSMAFVKRLVRSGFARPILTEINAVDSLHANYVSHETFRQLAPSVILITEYPSDEIDLYTHIFQPNKSQLIIDTIGPIEQSYFPFFQRIKQSPRTPIHGAIRAFGNLSNWEIENGTRRAPVAVQQQPCSPGILKFIHDLNCFERGILPVDECSYPISQSKSFHGCFFPIIATLLTFGLSFLIGIIQFNHQQQQQKISYQNSTLLLFRQASSITGSTSLILLAFIFLIRPVLELIKFCSIILQKFLIQQPSISNNKQTLFVQRWLRSRGYLIWYSLLFAFLHLIFLIFTHEYFHFGGFIFGLITFFLLILLATVHLPWISERLIWHEYHFLTDYLGPFCLLIALIHVLIILCVYWKQQPNDYSQWNLKFFAMILPLFVIILRLIIYTIVYPIRKFIRWFKRRREENLKTTNNIIKDNPLLP